MSVARPPRQGLQASGKGPRRDCCGTGRRQRSAEPGRRRTGSRRCGLNWSTFCRAGADVAARFDPGFGRRAKARSPGRGDAAEPMAVGANCRPCFSASLVPGGSWTCCGVQPGPHPVAVTVRALRHDAVRQAVVN